MSWPSTPGLFVGFEKELRAEDSGQVVLDWRFDQLMLAEVGIFIPCLR
jgi:hypothetical protein